MVKLASPSSLGHHLPASEWEIAPSRTQVLMAIAARGIRISINDEGQLLAGPREKIDPDSVTLLKLHRSWIVKHLALEPETQDALLIADLEINLRLQAARIQRLQRLPEHHVRGLLEAARTAFAATDAIYQGLVTYARRESDRA